MASTVTYVDTFQTRFMNSFVNLTRLDNTKWPAITATKFEYSDTNFGNIPPLTAYYVYDQFALRVASLSGLQTIQTAV